MWTWLALPVLAGAPDLLTPDDTGWNGVELAPNRDPCPEGQRREPDGGCIDHTLPPLASASLDDYAKQAYVVCPVEFTNLIVSADNPRALVFLLGAPQHLEMASWVLRAGGDRVLPPAIAAGVLRGGDAPPDALTYAMDWTYPYLSAGAVNQLYVRLATLGPKGRPRYQEVYGVSVRTSKKSREAIEDLGLNPLVPLMSASEAHELARSHNTGLLHELGLLEAGFTASSVDPGWRCPRRPQLDR